jgi:GR25 family glycosyltransferase involved in LPS biosynthesis
VFETPWGTRSYYKIDHSNPKPDTIYASDIKKALQKWSFVNTGTCVLLEPNAEHLRKYKSMVKSMQPFGLQATSGMDEQSLAYYYSVYKDGPGADWKNLGYSYAYMMWKYKELKQDIKVPIKIIDYFGRDKPWDLAEGAWDDLKHWYAVWNDLNKHYSLDKIGVGSVADIKINTLPHIYIVNLDRFPEKYERTVKKLRAAGVTTFSRWSAYDGLLELPGSDKIANETDIKKKWQYNDEMKQQLIEQRIVDPDTEFYFRPGEVGHYITFNRIFQDAAEKNLGRIIIFEDDIDIVDPTAFLTDYNNLMKATPSDWDVIYFGLHKSNRGNVRINNYVSTPRGLKKADKRKNMILGNYANVYNTKAIQLLASNMRPMKFPTDGLMGNLCTKTLKCYSSTKNLIVPLMEASTTQTFDL